MAKKTSAHVTHVKLLDCTLRDGAYPIDKNFGNIALNGIINGLLRANVDIIEIGFLQNDGYCEGKTVFENSIDAQRYVPREKAGRLFTVLADFCRYDIAKLDYCSGLSFDAVRACFAKNERSQVFGFCKGIKEKGYNLFVQPMGILSYTDFELIELIKIINELEPYCFSIVDTFGSMYMDDLYRVYNLVHHNLTNESRIGFHSHNNLQMSNALSQEFAKISIGQREVVIDATVSGLGRGAGNTPTELIAQFLNSKLGYKYNIDEILDVIDVYINNLRSQCEWGYSTHLFLAGTLNAHANNIAWLSQKASLRSKDVRLLINLLDANSRKRYSITELESVYLEYLASDVDDSSSMTKLSEEFRGRNVLVLAPGKSIVTQADRIRSYRSLNDLAVIAVNFFPEVISADFLYMNNARRFAYIKTDPRFNSVKRILTSNILSEMSSQDEFIVSFKRLIKPGWEYLDNSTILLLRLLDLVGPNSIAIAGLDGFDGESTASQYASPDLAPFVPRGESIKLNKEIQSMLNDYILHRKSKCPITFLTKSRFTIPD